VAGTDKPSLLQWLHQLVQYDYLHAPLDQRLIPRLPDFIEALPEGRVQDLPGGQLPASHQVPYEQQVQLAVEMARDLREQMPSRVCAVCSEVCSAALSEQLTWAELPNAELLRADMDATDVVPRWAHTVYLRPVPVDEVQPAPSPVLPYRYPLTADQRRLLQAHGLTPRSGQAAAAMVDDAADDATGGAGALDADEEAAEEEEPATDIGQGDAASSGLGAGAPPDLPTCGAA
jgi:hypothetical protein